MPINESYHISSFRSRKFIDRFFDSCLILSFQIGKKIETVSWNPYLNTRTLCFYKERSVFGQGKICVSGRKSFAKYFLSEFSILEINPHRKNYISGYIWHRSFIQTVKCSFFNQIIVYQSFYGAPLTFNYVLLQGKFLCFGTCRQVACEMFV